MKTSPLVVCTAALALASLLANPPMTTAADKKDENAVDTIALRGMVVGADGKPARDVEVSFRLTRVVAQTATDNDGRFELRISKSNFRGGLVVARSRDQLSQAMHQFDWNKPPAESTVELTLKLEPAKRIAIHVVDGQGNAVKAARAGVAGTNYWGIEPVDSDVSGNATLLIPANATVYYVYAYKNALGLDYRSFFDRRSYSDKSIKNPEVPSTPVTLTLDGAQTLRVRVVDADDKPIKGVKLYPWLLNKEGQLEELNLSYMANEFTQTTVADGMVEFNWIPRWNTQPITIWPTHEDYVRQRGNYDPKQGDGTLTMKLDRLVPISGRATLPDGKPAANILIRAQGNGFTFDDFRGETKTDAEGRYRLKAAPNMVYLLLVDDVKWAAEPRSGFAVWPNKPLADLNFKLRSAIRIFGRVTVGAANKPVKGQQISMYQYGRDGHNLEDVKLPNPENSNRWVQPMYVRWTTTDDDGRYELFVGPGNYDLRGPQQNEIQKFDLAQEKEYEVNFHAPRPEKGTLRGLVLTGNPPTPVANAKVIGIYRHQLGARDMEAITDGAGKFEVERHLHTTVIHAQSSDGTLAGVVEIDPDAESVTIPVQKPATAGGRLIHAATNKPLASREVIYGVRVYLGEEHGPFQTAFGGRTTTDADGGFELKSLVVGQEYDVNVTLIDRTAGSQTRVYQLVPVDSEHVDLGDVPFKEPVPYKPPTLAERIAKEFNRPDDAKTRFKNALRDSKLSRQHVLIIFADPQASRTEQFFQLRYDDNDVRSALDSYRTVAIPTTGPKAAEASLLAKSVGVELEKRTQPVLCIVDSDEHRLATNEVFDLVVDDKVDANNLINLFNAHALEPLDARQLLQEGLAAAKKQGKRVLVQESATWCGPCWMLSRFLDKHHKTWEADYVWVKMDHRWTDCSVVMQPLRNNAPGGIPWLAILDADGNVLVTSNDKEGENIGFPTAPSEIKHFKHMLKTTAVHMTDKDIESLVVELKKGAE